MKLAWQGKTTANGVNCSGTSRDFANQNDILTHTLCNNIITCNRNNENICKLVKQS